MLLNASIMKKTGLACALTYAAISAAHAQTADLTLEEIVVTAQKREVDLQKTAASVVAIQREELERKGINSIENAVKEVAGVQFNATPQGGVGGSIFIRGVGANFLDPQIAAQPSVAINVNGVVTSSQNAVQGSLFDVDRIEVLRGPQGTLYGSGAEAGVVNVVLTDPQSEFQARGRIQVGNYDARNVEGVLNFPLIQDLLAIRVTASNNKRGGYLRGPGAWVTPNDCAVVTSPTAPFPLQDANACTGNGTTVPYQKVAFVADNYGASNTTVYRLKAKLTPTDWLSIVGTYEDTNSFAINTQRVPVANWNAGDKFYVSATTSGLIKADSYADKAKLYQFDVVADLGNFATLTFRPARREQNPVSTVANVPSMQSVQKTYELLLNSQQNSAFTWTVGAYMRDLSQDTGTSTGTVTAPTDDGRYGIRNLDRPISEKNAFADVTIPLTPAFRLSMGGRYTNNSSTYDYELFRTPGVTSGTTVPVANIQSGGVFSKDYKKTGFTYKFGFEYDVAAESLLYATASSGFKAGGIGFADQAAVINSPSDVLLNTYKPEKSINFEVGSKNRFFDNRLQLNGDVYYTLWKDMQLSNNVCSASSPGCNPQTAAPTDLTYVVVNADKGKKYGLELETTWLATQNDRINLNLSAQRGKYGNLAYYWFGQYKVLTGHDMSNTPALSGTLGYEHSFQVGQNASIRAKVDENFSTSYFNSQEFWLTGAEVGGYGKTDMTVTLDLPNWSVNAFVRNLTDRIQNQFAHPQGYSPSEPRTYGVGITGSFR